MSLQWTEEWENEIGEVAYQPRLPGGETLWKSGGLKKWQDGSSPNFDQPVLYQSRRRAERIAKREQLQTAKETWRRTSR